MKPNTKLLYYSVLSMNMYAKIHSDTPFFGYKCPHSDECGHLLYPLNHNKIEKSTIIGRKHDKLRFHCSYRTYISKGHSMSNPKQYIH